MTDANRRAIHLAWTGEGMVFEGKGTTPPTPSIVVDGDNAAGPGPMLTLLVAAAACSASDIVHVLAKMRVTLRELSVDIEGVRRDDYPRRYDAIHLRYRAGGDGLDDAKMDRAVELSLEKYCSVMASLAPDIAVSYDIELTNAASSSS